jgi:hypothetical protein
MTRKRLLLVGLAVLVSFAGVAFAQAVKTDLLPQAPASDPDSGASGQAVLNYAKGADKTEVQINAEGLTPGATYFPGIFGSGGFPYVTAGPNGKINVHAEVSGDVSALDAGVYRVGGPLVLRTP